LCQITTDHPLTLLMKWLQYNEVDMAKTLTKKPTLILRGPLISLIFARDNNMICAFCPELDITTEMSTEEEALIDVLDAIRDYAREYKSNFKLYRKSPNRAHHWPYIRAILKTKNNWELRKLLDIRYGDIHLQ
jgi:hypothetical protein